MKKAFLFLFLMILIPTTYYYWPEKKLDLTQKVTRIVVFKSKRLMNVYAENTLLKSYTIALGDAPIGDKTCEGDEKTPEGTYTINAKNPHSICHKNLGISYPNDADRALSQKLGKPTGGDIKIHGLLNGQGRLGKFHRFKDWTNGCIGVTDDEIDELYQAVSIGTPIIINP